MMRIFVAALTFLLVVVMTAQDTPRATLGKAPKVRTGETELGFEVTRPCAMAVKAKVNGRPAVMLLDTGAAQTVVSVDAAGISPMELAESRFTSALALRGEAVLAPVDIQLGRRTWRQYPVAVMRLGEVSKTYGRRIDGLIGYDLLSQFDYVILDFKARCLWLAE